MIKQTGKGNQISLGDNSSNNILKKSKINFSKENRRWFFSGILLPIISGLVIEILISGSTSHFFLYLINFF